MLNDFRECYELPRNCKQRTKNLPKGQGKMRDLNSLNPPKGCVFKFVGGQQKSGITLLQQKTHIKFLHRGDEVFYETV